MNNTNEIISLTPEEMNALIESYDKTGLGKLLLGKYITHTNPNVWTAADNSKGECYVEEFDTEEKARFWLEKETYNKEEVENYFKREAIEEGCKDYRVYCCEKLSKDVVVRAKSAKEAEEIADQAWSDGLIEVDWDNCESCTCDVQEERSINGFGTTDYEMYRRTVDGKNVEEF